MASMEKLLQEKDCHLEDRVQDWKEVVHIAYEPLIEQSHCITAYEDATYEITERPGPYYVFCENLALIHASNRSSVNDTQMAVTVLKELAKFEPDGYDVRVLVTLVAKDNKSHMEGIQAVSNISFNGRKIQKVLDATRPEGVFDLFVSNACKK